MNLNLVVTTLIAGGLLLLSFLKLSNAIEVNRKANIYFGIFVFLWATFWLDEMIIPEEYHHGSIVILCIRFVQFLAPLTFFLSVQYYIKPDYKYSPKDIGFLAAPFMFFILLSCRQDMSPKIFNLLYIILILGHSLFYALLAYMKIQKHQKDIELFSSDTESIDLRWLKYIIFSFIASAILMIGYSIFSAAEALNIYINLYFLITVYLVAFYSIRQKEIYPKGLNIEETTQEGFFTGSKEDAGRTRLMDDNELNKTKEALLELMEAEKPYLDSELNLLKLADNLGITSHQLSYVLNKGFGENFFCFVNKYRVRTAEELLIDPGHDYLNIVAIGYEAGFNSKTSFNTVFKKMTSYTPTEYKKKRSGL